MHKCSGDTNAIIQRRLQITKKFQTSPLTLPVELYFLLHIPIPFTNSRNSLTLDLFPSTSLKFLFSLVLLKHVILYTLTAGQFINV